MMHLAVIALLLQVGQPRWAALQDIRLGGSVDAILAKGGECGPGDDHRAHQAGAAGEVGEC